MVPRLFSAVERNWTDLGRDLHGVVRLMKGEAMDLVMLAEYVLDKLFLVIVLVFVQSLGKDEKLGHGHAHGQGHAPWRRRWRFHHVILIVQEWLKRLMSDRSSSLE